MDYCNLIIGNNMECVMRIYKDRPSKGVNLLGELAEQDVFGRVRKHQHHVDMTWSQLHQITGVSDVR